ncbi:hypothetical protein AMS68_003344 [Peltaster fructicola]|uniref:2EXR domain-containing protein n=1 Tax=Peltaster fructicola TaxID=286661 RepID=A0A6H0XST7_9PEZI|nr:hypothetical protein AMS68_003344 [Peltaster fructicola]
MTTKQDKAWQFPRFMDLPLELREMIWQACLPFRVRELDDNSINIWINKDDEGTNGRPCTLWHTSVQNVKPPTITRVCHESRRVAFKAGRLRDWDKDIRTEHTMHPTPPFEWVDRQRTSPHIEYDMIPEEWPECVEGMEEWEHDVLGRLAKAVTSDSAPGSFRETLLFGWDPGCQWAAGRPNAYDAPITASPRVRPLARTSVGCGQLAGGLTFEGNEKKYIALKQHVEWLVVMEIVILHCAADAIATKLFGVYGDAPIQIIKVEEKDKLDQLYDLLAEDDAHDDVLVTQYYTRRTAKEWKDVLRSGLWAQQYPDELNSRLHPAILFRVCHEACNRKEFEHPA